MKHKNFYILLTVTINLLIFGYGMYYYYAPPIERKPYTIERSHDDTIRMAYIGDSWAFFHRPHDEKITDSLSRKLNRPTKVTSFGCCGRTSKEIYWYIFDNPELATFMSKGYDYCFVAVGINDANKKMSVNYYKQSMAYIIQFLLANQITPIILEIPDYDIENCYEVQIPSRKLLRPFSRFVTGTPINCKKEYRQALNNLFVEKRYGDKVQIVKYRDWNDNYTEDLKNYYNDDGIHLNEKGYAKLDSCIIQICAKLHQIRHGKN